MSYHSTISVLSELLSDLYDKPDSECPKNYIKALENAVELFKNHPNSIPYNLSIFKDQYLPQFEIQFLTGNQSYINFNNKIDFQTFISNYASNDEQYILVNGTSFYTEFYNGVYAFSPSIIKKIFAQYP